MGAPALFLVTLLAQTLATPTPAPGSDPVAPSAAAARPKSGFRLFPFLALPMPDFDPSGLAEGAERLFHQAGDPDSLFTFGGATPHGEPKVRLAVEANDIVLRAIAPDGRIDPRDTRPRAPGDYQALDGAGRPYQLRLGARLVW